MTVTADDYARAESLQANRLLTEAIFNCSFTPVAIAGSNTFWYRVTTSEGPRFKFVDADNGIAREAFDHEAVAKQLGDALGQDVTAATLPIAALDYSKPGAIGLRLPGALFWWDEVTKTLAPDGNGGFQFSEAPSPDSNWTVTSQGHNLVLRSLQTGESRQLTTDGEERHAYAKHPDGIAWSHELERIGFTMPAPVIWSKDSSHFVTVRMDERAVGEHWYITSSPADESAPTLRTKAYPMAGDEHLPEIDYLVVDAKSGEITCTDLRIDSPYVTMLGAGHTHFSNDGKTVYTVCRDRWHRSATLYAIDIETGSSKTLLTESTETQIDLHPMMMACNARFTDDTFIWWSERSGWGHLYLYDINTGELVKPLTEGDWLVHSVLKFDGSTVWFTACGRDSRDPYLQRLYRLDIESGEVQLLDDEEMEHKVTRVGDYFVDTISDVTDFGRSVLRDQDGKILMTLEEADTSRLAESGFRYPDRVALTAADGKTEIWANVWLPKDLDPGKKYPVVEDCYPGPQINKAPITLNTAFGWGDCSSLASMGFIVLQIDGRGTPLRDKAFHDHSYKNIQNGSDLDDHIAALNQLAEIYPLDLDRVGIYGTSGGGYMSTRAMLTKPDTYKVAVSNCGNHDQRIYWSNWGEKYHGPIDEADYLEQSNTTHAANLKGRLLLIHGELDDNVSSAHTLRLVDKLIQHDLDFDMIIVPNAGHMFLGKQAFVTRKRWDYLVTHLMGTEPPAGYHLTEPPMDLSILLSMFG